MFGVSWSENYWSDDFWISAQEKYDIWENGYTKDMYRKTTDANMYELNTYFVCFLPTKLKKEELYGGNTGQNHKIKQG